MKIQIRKGRKEDLKSVLNLIKELAEYENAIDEVTITLKELESDGFGNSQHYKFLVAVIDEKIIGLSFYWFRYSTWKGKTVHLEDLIVTKNMRNKGIGALLLDRVILFGKEMGVKRIEKVGK